MPTVNHSSSTMVEDTLHTTTPVHNTLNDTLSAATLERTHSGDNHKSSSTSTTTSTSVDHAGSSQERLPLPVPERKLRVAVVGSGLAGLTVAHVLSSLHTEDGQGKEGIEVELFEKAHKLGMDAASLSVTCPCQKCAIAAGRDNGDPNHEHVEGRMDVPMRTFFAVSMSWALRKTRHKKKRDGDEDAGYRMGRMNSSDVIETYTWFDQKYYPNLVRLYRSIGVKLIDADNTLACFDVAFDSQLPASRLTKDVNIEEPYLSSRSYKVSSDHTITLPDLPPLSLRNPYPFGRRLLGYYRIARDYVKMLTVSKEFMTENRMTEIGKDRSEWGNGRKASLREFLVNGGYSHDFSAFFVPLFACVCTCSFDRMMEYPACVVLEYVARCMPFGRMQFVSLGVREVTENLSKNIGTIHYNTLIEKIIETDPSSNVDGNKAPIILVDSNGVHREFDHVIFATQANQAAATLAGQRASKPLPKPYVTSREKGYDESNYGRREEHDLTDPETPKDVTPETIPQNNPFYHQIQTLSKFPYERTQVICHTDTAFLPKNPASWRLLNIAKSTTADILASPFDQVTAELEQQQQTSTGFSIKPFVASDQNELTNRKKGHDSGIASPEVQSGSSTPITTASQSHNSAMATHIMNNTASSLGTTTKFLQTTNPIFQPKPETVISSAWFERAVVNPESMKAVDELNQQMEEQTERLLAAATSESTQATSVSDRVWFVGSYAYPGIPLLEGCVVSAVQVMERIIAAEPAHRLAASVTAAKESFLKRDEPMRERRLRRKQELEQHPIGDNSATAVYFKTAWKDTLEDERIWEQQEKKRLQEEEAQLLINGSSSGRSLKKGYVFSAVGSWTSSVYVEVAFMLFLYIVAIVQWWAVFLIESAGFDGSRWALA
ncbi:hypothetical protein BGX26_010614 [Mortierella sp. AD094]|nr:hypothetical protein BGX26_010614 [Mortierella sp. AD094]